MTARTHVAAVARSLAAIGLAGIVAACGGASATATPAAPTAAPVTVAPATVAPASQAPAASGFPMPSFHGDTELEAMLPDEIGGTPVVALSMTGEQFLGGGLAEGTEELQALLTQLGKTPADLSVAFGGAGTVTIVAFRIKGVPAATIYESLKTIAQQQGAATITPATLGGKSVQQMVPADGSGASYIYGSGDTVFIVGGPGVTDAQLNEAFSKLP